MKLAKLALVGLASGLCLLLAMTFTRLKLNPGGACFISILRMNPDYYLLVVWEEDKPSQFRGSIGYKWEGGTWQKYF